jgi:hypothetical protein
MVYIYIYVRKYCGGEGEQSRDFDGFTRFELNDYEDWFLYADSLPVYKPTYVCMRASLAPKRLDGFDSYSIIKYIGHWSLLG